MSIFCFNHDKDSWESSERKKILELFANHVYGVRPPETKARFEYRTVKEEKIKNITRRHVEMRYRDARMNFFLYLPEHNRPLPAFVYIMHPHQVSKYCFPEETDTSVLPLSKITGEGFAVAVLIAGDVAKDEIGGEKSNLLAAIGGKREENSWAVISAWALGASKVLDYLETLPEIESQKVATIGHSRGGKTALWAAATDGRFAMAISCCSGNTGAALSRGSTGETVKQINDRFPHWFCDNYKKYNGRENDLPVDQHLLLALQAPRHCYVSSATEDAWADPDGELLSCKLASPAYEMYGREGLVMRGPLITNHSYDEGSIGYHRTTGKHMLTERDWEKYLAFFKKHLL
jgi:dienelactone hydrolase